MSRQFCNLHRRELLKGTAALLAATGAAGSIGLARRALANKHPHPHAGSLDFLDPETYRKNCEVHAHFHGGGRAGKSQMMARGARRFIFAAGQVWEVTEARRPTLIDDKAFIGSQVQLAYNGRIGKWILITNAAPPPTSATPNAPHGKYDDPRLVDNSRYAAGLRGIRVYDATDPESLRLLSKWSCDQGDPDRAVQTGGGTHRNYYDGGKYAYLDAAPDNSFINMESPWRVYTNCLQVIDVEDPERVKFVSNWWFPGQRAGEQAAYRKWREYGDRASFTAAHGGFYVPRKVEDGGRYCYSSYGSFGITILDVSDPKNPRLASRWRPPYLPGAIPFHTADVSWLDRGILIGTAETLNPDCNEPFHPNYVLDVSDVERPRPIAQFGQWQPPPSAPYDNFCDKRGRFGTHNPPHTKAPGKRHGTFIAYAAFNAGFQFMDFTDPARPSMDGYFIPPTGGSFAEPGSWNRIGDGVFVEWDRRLIWAFSDSGVYLLSHPALGEPEFEPRTVDTWSLDGLNQGHDRIA